MLRPPYLIGLLWLALVVAVGTPASALPLEGSARSVDQASCRELAKPGLFPATMIKSAVWQAAASNPAFCEVTGIISPVPGSHIGVIYRLPSTWNGRMLGLGGGGMAGNVKLETALVPLRMGFGTAQTDAGHESDVVWDTGWAVLPDGRQNWPAMEDFAYRAVHLMTATGKAVMARFYGVAVSRAYFQGCSTGGRQALMEAQRFPADYDGILAGAPVYDERVANSMVNSGRIFDDPRSKLDASAIKLVNDAVLAACDTADGLKDGIVTMPASCRWDPRVLACRGGTGQCLSEPQVAALVQSYLNVKAPDGRIAAFGLPMGAELTSLPIFMTWGAAVPEKVGLDKWREAQFEDAHFDYRNWDVGRDYFRIRTTPFAFMYDATNPDLSPFVAKGGKLILWHGLYDQLPREASTENYYRRARAVTQAMLDLEGGAQSTASGLIYFELPGVSHCQGGPGADSFDGLQAIVEWVEQGRAPDRLMAYKQDHEAPVPQSAHLADQPVRQAKPLCPYPTLPFYKGSGNPAVASSYACRKRPDRS